jgi:hypothetical protein
MARLLALNLERRAEEDGRQDELGAIRERPMNDTALSR